MTARGANPVDPIESVAATLGDRVRRGVPLGPFTTYRVGGAAQLLAVIETESDLQRVSDAVHGTRVEVLVVGKGSNLLVADGGFAGLALVLGDAWSQVSVDDTMVQAGGAAFLPVVARRTAAAGLTGFEWAVGVPGSVGGAVRMNAGGHGSDMAASLVKVRRFDLATGEDGWVPAAALDLGYRHSAIGRADVVLAAELGLARGERTVAEALIADIVRWRRTNQPGGQNAGSVFTNPPGDSAGRLIDAAGLKGLRIGSASVSTKHANFFIADPGGRAGDVVALMTEVRDRVAAATGVVLTAETHLVGFGREVEVER
jgi:UDP-N-acetylmuramate dehydrogenase